VPQSHGIVTHHLGTNFWEKNLGCLIFLYEKTKNKNKNWESRSQHFSLFPFYPQPFNMKKKYLCRCWFLYQ